MNPLSSSSARTLVALLADRKHLLLDFDGPVCRLFAGRPAPHIAQCMLDLLTADLRGEVESTDPHEVLRRVHTSDPEQAVVIERVLSHHEREAAATATPTPQTRRLIATARRTGRTVSIVSNNSATAVERYLNLHDLDRYIDAVEGRTPDSVNRMKPDPTLVRQALDHIEAEPRTAVLVGNSPSDITAARNAGVEAIGFVDRPAKRRTLATATALVTNLPDLVDAITDV